MHLLIGRVALLLTLISVVNAAAADPSTKPAGGDAGMADNSVISPSRVQDLKGITYVYLENQATLNDIQKPVREMMAKLDAALSDGQFKPVGPAVIRMLNVTQDRSAQITLQCGFPVAPTEMAEGAKPAHFQMTKLDAFHCDTVIFSGPMEQVGKAYQSVFADVNAGGLQPTGEIRQLIMMWEGENSINNVTMIQVGVQ